MINSPYLTGRKRGPGKSPIDDPLRQIDEDYATPTVYGTPETPLLDTPSRWVVGDRVEAKYTDGEYYDANIDAVNPDTYVVVWAQPYGDELSTELKKDEVRPYVEPNTPVVTSFWGSAGNKISGAFTLSAGKVKSAIRSAKRFIYQGI